jgi:hypothetical protein
MCHRPSILDIREKVTGGQNTMLLQFISFGNKLECSDSADQENLRELVDSEFGDISDAFYCTTTKI